MSFSDLTFPRWGEPVAAVSAGDNPNRWRRLRGATVAAAVSAVLLFGAPLRAVHTEAVTHETYRNFLDGELRNLSLHVDGRLELAPEVAEVARLVDAVVWSAVAAPDGSLYVAAGNDGKVYQVSLDGEGRVAEVMDTEEVFVRALAVGPDGFLYAGSSPDGKVYRLHGDDEIEVFFEPRETYIWSLVFASNGDLLIGTGDQGRIYRVPAGAEPGGAGTVYFDSDETHMAALAFDSDGRLLAGSSPNGYIFRIHEKDEAFLLFNSPDEEIRQILPDSEGGMYVATHAGDSGGGSGAVAEAMASISSESAGATDSGESESASASSSTSGGKGKRLGGVFHVDADGFYEAVWSLPGVSIHALQFSGEGEVLTGTGTDGRIFAFSEPHSWRLRQTVPAGADVSVLVPHPEAGLLAVTSNPARVYRLNGEADRSGEFLSKVFDASQVALWGRLYVETGGGEPETEDQGSKTKKIETSIRTGNSEKPDATWSSWQPVDALASGKHEARPARYMQYRLSVGEGTEAIRRVQFFFRHRNAAPVISAVRVVANDLGLESFELPPQQPTIDLDQLFRDTGGRTRGSQEPRTQIRAYERSGTVTVAWQARDPNGDELVFDVQLQQVGSEAWETIGADIGDRFFSFHGNGFDDGRYRVRVIARDGRANRLEEARETSRLSQEFVIDNTAPEIVPEEILVNGAEAEIGVLVRDATSRIVAADYLLDGGDPETLFPEDGLYDAREERFVVRLEELKPGRHTLLVRVLDEARNLRVRQIPIEVPGIR